MSIVLDISLNCFDELDDKLEISDEMLMFAQEIWLCMNIEQYEHIADTKSGRVALKQVLFDRNINTVELKSLIKTEISENCAGASLFRFDVDVKAIKATINDIILVDTIIYDNNDIPFKQRFIYQ